MKRQPYYLLGSLALLLIACFIPIHGSSIATAAYAVIENAGTPLTQQSILNFTGSGISCANDGTNKRTTCTVSGGSGSFGGVNVKTSNYTLQASDSGLLVVMNCSGACAATMFGTPGSSFSSAIISIGSTLATVSLNSLDYNGTTSAPLLTTGQILSFGSDGTNYFGNEPFTASTNVTFTPGSNNVAISATGGGGGGSANPSCTFTTASTGCGTPTSINVSSLNASSVNQLLVQCWTTASTTQSAVAVLTYVDTVSGGIVQTVAPTFATSAAGGYCTVNGNGSGGSSSGNTFPLTIVQESSQFSGSGTSYTVTFPQTAASSGNTLFMFASLDGNQTITNPSGWTVDINQAEATYARFEMLHKASGSDTSATFTYTGETANMSVYFMEVVGTHALDQHANSGIGNANNVTFSAITPSAGSAVFAFVACVVAGSGSTTGTGPPAPSPSINPLWRPLATQTGINGGRSLFGFGYVNAATNTAITPPQLGINSATLFSSGGIALATISIL